MVQSVKSVFELDEIKQFTLFLSKNSSSHFEQKYSFNTFPAGTQYQNDVVSTSTRRDDVASTLIRRHFNVVCSLGRARNVIKLTF